MYLPHAMFSIKADLDNKVKSVIGSELLEQYGIEYFRGASTLGALSPDAIHYLLDNGHVFELNKGETLFSYNEPGNSFFVILKGCIQFFKIRENKAKHIRDYQFGQEIGSVAMIGLHNRVGDSVASENCIILQVSCSVFYGLHETLPTDFGILLLNLSREMARRLRESDDKLADHKATDTCEHY
ncbi:conserved hypothetical protein [Neptunomonas japonica JAMM 1380]|uniref:Cyclic nucleotide-binding domain-containing protein n=1 Tax=Neptunomonas japonica JAMM 1380 TaxID=1441457 RepID=A0A7R6PBM8_9GAMM|nr:conserved hypothetical protein [Neptunomonas japonica JAMM 1380]